MQVQEQEQVQVQVQVQHLGVGSAGEPHGGGGEEPRVQVGGEAVEEQLAVRGQTLAPTLPCRQ